jgi:hypothetical protein
MRNEDLLTFTSWQPCTVHIKYICSGFYFISRHLKLNLQRQRTVKSRLVSIGTLRVHPISVKSLDMHEIYHANSVDFLSCNACRGLPSVPCEFHVKTECTLSCALGEPFFSCFAWVRLCIKKVDFLFGEAQTVESTASNAAQINVCLYSWIRAAKSVIWDVAKYSLRQAATNTA